ncbi:response regulator transcription factor [Helcococcus ovis]|uniref:Response regulator transcription factor n=1 Tax=Helcococcus ovis TaxID=72026 RepID=A0A4R9C192_9FIRM|nr:response regulator transcription factor [Helcococcus ovis]TFF63993.1 response regulator transcription factor [Helcococcus ovis]TFF65056.1 response regulator transcription factor [Helcococcus ovis]
MYKIYIVEDDSVISNSMKKFLESWGYQVEIPKKFNNVLEEFEEFNPDLVLLDIHLPFFNGYNWCEKIRTKSNAPIIFISSSNDNMNIVMALSKGADDFVSKPFDLNILNAKIQALLRRTYELNSTLENIYTYKDIIYNMGKSTLSYKDETIELTKNESKIFQILIENKERIVSRNNIMEFLWNTDEFIDDNTLTVNINRLRKKMMEIGIKEILQTKKGQGYILIKED